MKTFLCIVTVAVFARGAALAGTTNSPFETLLNGNATIRLAQSCSSGMSYCKPGSYGPGGCYNIGYATCTAGLVWTGGMEACKPGNGKQAYCYKPGYG